MKNFLLMLTITVLASCGPKTEKVSVIEGDDGNPGLDGSSCSTQQLENGAKITCGDGSFSYLFNGSSGSSASNGEDGSSCSVEATKLGAIISCTDGSSASILNGEAGSSGENGSDGQSCSLEEIENGALITCGEESVAIYNGERGEDGEDSEDNDDDSLASLVTITSYSSSNCTLVAGSSYYVKNNGSNTGIYSTNNCASNSKVFEMGNGDSFWFANSILGARLTSGGVRVISFNLN